MQNLKLISFIVCLVHSTNLLFAQFTPPPFSPPNINNTNALPIYHDIIPMKYGTEVTNNLRYSLQLTYTNGNTDTLISKFYKTKGRNGVFIIDEAGAEIFPHETKSILARKKKLTGFPHDSLWLFPINQGKISTYYYLPDTTTMTFSHIQKGDGAIEKFSKKKFKAMISDNEKALKLYKNKTLYPYIGIALFASGAAMLAKAGSNGGSNNGLVLTGVTLGAASTPFIILFGQNRTRKTLEVYNKN